MPDNVLFADQAGEVFKVLMEDCDVHTVLRCPRGTFSPYTDGHQDQRPVLHQGRADRRQLWIYDARANVPKITKKIAATDGRRTSPSSSGATATIRTAEQAVRVRLSPRTGGDSFTLDEIKEHHYKLDGFKWLRDEELDDPDELPEPEELITEAMEELQLALDDLADIQRLLEDNGGEP